MKINQSFNGYMTPPVGYPVTLQLGHEVEMVGVIGPEVDTVTANVTALKSAMVHMSLSACPSTSGGADGDILSQTNTSTGVVSYALTAQVVSNAATDVVLSVPSWITVHQPYVLRIWISDVTGDVYDTAARSSAVTDTTKQAKVPGYVLVNSVKVS